jgi:hypothetical protein
MYAQIYIYICSRLKENMAILTNYRNDPRTYSLNMAVFKTSFRIVISERSESNTSGERVSNW